MAEETETGGGFEAMVSRKIGPLPLWSWLMMAGAAAFLIYRLKGGSSSSSSSGNTGQGDQFSSTSTQSGTTASGGQYSNSYTASGNGYLPGMLTDYGSPMGYSGGDVYVNYPTSNNNNPVPYAWDPNGTTNYTVTGTTTPSDAWPGGVAIAAYGINPADAVDIAVESIIIESLNPNTATPYPTGTVLTIPAGSGTSTTNIKNNPQNGRSTANS